MPTCTNCSAQPEMVCVKSGKVLGMYQPHPGGPSYSWKQRHPLLALAMGLYKGIAWLDKNID